jgi:hypothetical protein
MMRGSARLNGTQLETGDGAAVEVSGPLTIEADTDLEALLFDLA